MVKELKVKAVIAKLDGKAVYSCTNSGEGLTEVGNTNACRNIKTKFMYCIAGYWEYYVLCCEEHVRYWRQLGFIEE